MVCENLEQIELITRLAIDNYQISVIDFKTILVIINNLVAELLHNSPLEETQLIDS